MSNSSKSTGNSSSDEYIELRRGPWTLEEDNLLNHYIACHGEGRWNLLAKHSGLRRTGKSCRLRWLNYLKPDVKHGNLTPQEQLMILELHSKWGNRWSKIAQNLPGRTDNEIKNYWRTRVQKQAHRLKIDSNSTVFQELIQSVWMPQLLQKIQKSSISSDISPDNSETQPLNHVYENSELSTQVQAQGPLDLSKTIYNLDQYHMKNSSLEHCTSPSISSSESMNIKHIPEIPEYPTRLFHDTAPYNVENGSYDMENFGLTAMSVPGYSENLIGETNWIDDDLANSLWNIDELWQFRQLQERSS